MAPLAQRPDSAGASKPSESSGLEVAGAGACFSEDTELAITGIRWESHAQSSLLPWSLLGPSQLPWQELIGRVARTPTPHLPMAMHSCRIWPKGRRRLNWSCPSKERESYQGHGAGERRTQEEKRGIGGNHSRPALLPESGRRGSCPPSGFTSQHPLSTQCLGSACPLTRVAVGQVPAACAVHQPIRGSRTVLYMGRE